MNSQRFTIEAVMLAIYGQLLVPGRQVEYMIPYTTIMELYEFQDDPQPFMPDTDDERHIRGKIQELIQFFEEPLNNKKITRSLTVPWKKASFPINESVTLQVVHAVDNAQYGEYLDPVETELVLTAIHEQAPLLSDQEDFIEKIIESDVSVQIFDIDDFEYALEHTEN